MTKKQDKHKWVRSRSEISARRSIVACTELDTEIPCERRRPYKDFESFWFVSASADAGPVVFICIGCEGMLRADPLWPGARRAGPALRLRSTPAWQGGGIATAGARGTSGGETAFPAPVGSELVDNAAKMTEKKTGPAAERRQLIEGRRAVVI